eukprot:m.391920 g.391920  ORF g.391920 m.391920 type:complete len:491 (+) comp56347_c0_seq5:191-1663(+)
MRGSRAWGCVRRLAADLCPPSTQPHLLATCLLCGRSLLFLLIPCVNLVAGLPSPQSLFATCQRMDVRQLLETAARSAPLSASPVDMAHAAAAAAVFSQLCALFPAHTSPLTSRATACADTTTSLNQQSMSSACSSTAPSQPMSADSSPMQGPEHDELTAQPLQVALQAIADLYRKVAQSSALSQAQAELPLPLIAVAPPATAPRPRAPSPTSSTASSPASVSAVSATSARSSDKPRSTPGPLKVQSFVGDVSSTSSASSFDSLRALALHATNLRQLEAPPKRKAGSTAPVHTPHSAPASKTAYQFPCGVAGCPLWLTSQEERAAHWRKEHPGLNSGHGSEVSLSIFFPETFASLSSAVLVARVRFHHRLRRKPRHPHTPRAARAIPALSAGASSPAPITCAPTHARTPARSPISANTTVASAALLAPMSSIATCVSTPSPATLSSLAHSRSFPRTWISLLSRLAQLPPRLVFSPPPLRRFPRRCPMGIGG